MYLHNQVFEINTMTKYYNDSLEKKTVRNVSCFNITIFLSIYTLIKYCIKFKCILLSYFHI